jgi:hypothetical protein
MDSYLPLQINARVPYSVYYRSHPNKSPSAIFVCCLEKPLKKGRVKKWFLHCGKIKSIELGEITKDSKTISHAVIEFKHKQSLRRSLDNAWLEQKINEQLGSIPAPVDVKVEKHLNRMEEDGFTLVLPKKPKSNKFDMVSQNNDFEPVKRNKKAKDFYNFQITDKKSLKKMKVEE